MPAVDPALRSSGLRLPGVLLHHPENGYYRLDDQAQLQRMILMSQPKSRLHRYRAYVAYPHK